MHDPLTPKPEDTPEPDAKTDEAASNPAPPANPAPEAPKPPAEPKDAAPKAFPEEGVMQQENFDGTPDDARFNQIAQGEAVKLEELAPQLKKVLIGAGWDLIGFDESAADLDVSLFLLNKDDQTREDGDFIFYGNEEALEGAIQHTGDSRTGAGSGDDEQIIVDFSKVPFDVVKIMVVLTIYDPDGKDYSFQNVRNVYMRVEDTDTNRELFRYFLDKELKAEHEGRTVANGLYIGFFERNANTWIFNAMGQIDDGGLEKIATKYGLVIVGAG